MRVVRSTRETTQILADGTRMEPEVEVLSEELVQIEEASSDAEPAEMMSADMDATSSNVPEEDDGLMLAEAANEDLGSDGGDEGDKSAECTGNDCEQNISINLVFDVNLE